MDLEKNEAACKWKESSERDRGDQQRLCVYDSDNGWALVTVRTEKVKRKVEGFGPVDNTRLENIFMKESADARGCHVSSAKGEENSNKMSPNGQF